MINGETKVYGLLGYPVAHSVSPAMHNAAFKALGMNCIYAAFPVHPEFLGDATASVRALGLGGVNVTVPHKETVLSFLDQLAEEARLIGAVNTIVVRDGKLVGHNTDAGGFSRSLTEQGFELPGKRVVVLGAGGAARAVAVQMALSGAERVVFVNRTIERAEALAGLVSGLGCDTVVRSWSDRLLGREIGDADLVVQTTALGMHPHVDDSPPVDARWFHTGQLVYDLVYNPRHTRFLQKAALAGARTASGLRMLLYQGVQAFELWTGRKAPVEEMRRALDSRFGTDAGD